MEKDNHLELRRRPMREWPNSYIIPNTSYILFWDPGESGRLPNIDTFRYWDDNPTQENSSPRLTIHYASGSYLDVCPELDTFVDATANDFVDGGGDCMLAHVSTESCFSWLHEIVERERNRYGRNNPSPNQDITKLLQAREEQLWTMPGENYGQYPPDALKALYFSKN